MSDDTRATEMRAGLATLMNCSTWNDLSIPLGYENQNFIQPKNTPWARFTITEGETTRNNMGNKQQRTLGLVTVQIFAPVNSGTDTARGIANAVATIYNERSGITTANGYFMFQVTSVKAIGEKNGWHQHNATTPFRFYYRKD